MEKEFPRLFSISQCKDSDVCEFVDWRQNWSGRCKSWNMGWRRERFEWEKPVEE